ncbi:class I SAM-dependent methyltransferase [Dehalococcoidia bacterium]|nr:class I SAM-dependent methyltransferase [Dehalococcoidia bacterium]MCL0038754.1 class I SAM-dependent methyltransferase [Dehalococcoidia bacterium]MCL0048113.1 class I SAM-dependent methyltransferase [Dehalococcoidia bacterium]MCL0049215.1 class I SAM-dependent methyltransferase [Dehalococcoidia bacterium]MCL0056333.1 class I SAM-dependent methyltransferase [Dehalococcoidia bacterium]
MEWVKLFYSNQHEWAGIYNGDVAETHRKNAATLQRLAGGRIGRLLELGAGGGQNAAALADLGYSVVAIELMPSGAKNAQKLASQPRKGQLRVIEGDFYEIEFPYPFDIVCYWDGFGIGSDEDQRRLLRRIASWLRPIGFALVEVYTPWYWAGAAGREMNFGKVIRRYDFNTESCRMLDRWWPVGHEEQAVTQSLRCYSPDDLQTLLKATGLTLESVESRGAFDPERGFVEHVPIQQAMQYLAKLIPESH